MTSKDESAGNVKHLLNQMEKEDGKRKQKKMAKKEKEVIGDESNDDDLSEDEFDDEDKEDVQAVCCLHIKDLKKVAAFLARFGWLRF